MAKSDLPPCEVCGKRGMWSTVMIGNDRWFLCYDHVEKYRVMVMGWFRALKAKVDY